MRCYFCNSEIPDDAVFCPECGKKLSDVPGLKKICPGCGTLLEEGEVFCPECGLPVTASSKRNDGTVNNVLGTDWSNCQNSAEVQGSTPGNQRGTKGAGSGTPGETYGQQGTMQKRNAGGQGTIQETSPAAQTGKSGFGKLKEKIPIIAAAALAIILFGGLAFKIFVLDKKDAPEPNIAESGQNNEENNNENEQAVSADYVKLSDVDFNLLEDDELIIEGLIKTTKNDEKVLRWDSTFSFYGVDFNGDKVLLEEVRNAYIDEASLPDGMLDSIKSNETVIIQGEFYIDEDRLYLTPDDIFDEDGNNLVTAFEKSKAEKAEDKKEKTADASSEYIIPDSDTRLLTMDDIKSLSLQQVNYAKNEIYARKGRQFQSVELQNYFNSKSWYKGTIAPSAFSESLLSDVEKKNVELLKNREFSMDSRGYQLDQN